MIKPCQRVGNYRRAFYTRSKYLIWNWLKTSLKGPPTSIPSLLQSFFSFSASRDLRPLFEYGHFLRKPPPYHVKYGSREISFIPNRYDYPTHMED